MHNQHGCRRPIAWGAHGRLGDLVSVRAPGFFSAGIGCRRIRSSSICNFGCGAAHCNRRSGFCITIFDGRSRGDFKAAVERVVVAGE